MTHESYQGKYGTGRFPSPAAVVNDALNKIQADGATRLVDEDNQEVVVVPPYNRVPVGELNESAYVDQLYALARVIHAAVTDLSMCRDSALVDRRLEVLAHYLTQYRQAKPFIAQATSLVKVDSRGRLHEPSGPTARAMRYPRST